MEIQITAIKFETVNGKKTGKSFSFKADPKKLAVFKTEATLRKKIKEYVAKSGIFKNEELDDVKYNMKDFLEEWKKQVAIVQAEELAKLEASPNNPDSRITPDMITRLAPNEVFVFGSNEQGLHYGGAAKAAVENFGAIMGQGNGLQGKSYAIPSMSGIGVMGEYVKEFCEFAKANPEKRFLVTEIGCGIAGYSIGEVAPLFECCRDVENVTLPASFWDIVGEPSTKEYDLERFVTAQAADYADAPLTISVMDANADTGSGISSLSRKDLVTATIQSIMVWMALTKLVHILPIPSLGHDSGKSPKPCSSMKANGILMPLWAAASMC